MVAFGCIRVGSNTFVFDISDVSVIVIRGVGHSLDTAVRKSNLVRSSDDFTVLGFLGTEFST